MQHYVLVFHVTRTVTPDEAKKRAEEIAAYVKQVTGMGIELDPKALGKTVVMLSSKDGKVVESHEPSDPSFTNLLFFDASEEQALTVARIHPGLHYGTTVELREWSSPKQAAAATAEAR